MSEFKMYIQSVNELPIDDWGYTAYLGATKRGLPVVFYEQIEEVPAINTNIIVGSIEDTIEFFKRLKIPVPEPMNVPKCLEPLAGRWVRNITIGEIDSILPPLTPFFIKPKYKGVFPNNILSDKKYRDYLDQYSQDTEIIVSKKVNFISEYRCFVVNGKIKSIHYYLGDYTVFPNINSIEIFQLAIEENIERLPVGFTMDIGVTDQDDTLLVECNDGWSIGSYGCDPTIYTNLLIKRWRQITGTYSTGV